LLICDVPYKYAISWLEWLWFCGYPDVCVVLLLSLWLFSKHVLKRTAKLLVLG